MSQTYTHKDLARKLKISETTIKSYRRKFPDCIPVASSGKPIRFLPEAVAVTTRIRDLFDLGMSVEEVRARLAQEFPWISLVGKEEQPQFPGMPQEFTIALSNLAKSMVTLLQQQNGIIDRMEKLEASIGEMGSLSSGQGGGVQAVDFKAVLEDLQGYLRNALMPLQQLQRLNEVQGVTEALHQTAANMVDAAQIMRSLADRVKGASGEAEAPSKIVRFPAPVAAPSPAPSFAQISQPISQDPPRAFLLRPMVVRTEEGAYISAGGRARGRFTVNDFKAILVYRRQPDIHYELRWEQVNGDWVATLTQPGDVPTVWRMHLKEAKSQSGVDIVELVGFAFNDETLHPAEFIGFLGKLTGMFDQ